MSSHLQSYPALADDVPQACEISNPLGRHLNGCRIGFDLGASDRKASAVIDGKVVYSEEVIWEPRKQADPDYHFREIMASLQSAAAHMPRVDAVGGSSAGNSDRQPAHGCLPLPQRAERTLPRSA